MEFLQSDIIEKYMLEHGMRITKNLQKKFISQFYLKNVYFLGTFSRKSMNFYEKDLIRLGANIEGAYFDSTEIVILSEELEFYDKFELSQIQYDIDHGSDICVIKQNELFDILNNEIEAQNEADPIKDRYFLFTGGLERYSRTKAQEIVIQSGGKILTSPSNKIDYLVVGQNTNESNKIKKIKEVINEGYRIKILDEFEFNYLMDERKLYKVNI